jgi:hypothetical protein
VNPNFEVDKDSDFFSLLEKKDGSIKSFSTMEKTGGKVSFKETELVKNDRVLLCKVNNTKGLFMLSNGSTEVDFI